MFNCYSRFIWMKRTGPSLGWTGRYSVSGVYCIMQIDDAAGQTESQLDGPWALGSSPLGCYALKLSSYLV